MKNAGVFVTAICLVFASQLAAQPRCTHDGGGGFRCLDGDGKTPVPAPAEYRIAGPGDRQGPRGAVPIGPSGVAPGTTAQPAAAAPGGSVVISTGNRDAAAAATGTTKTCSWDASQGVTCK